MVAEAQISRMRRKGMSDLMINAVIFTIIVVVLVSLIAYNIYKNSNNASGYADYYAKEIAKTIDLAKPGDNITLDVQKATEIAVKNNVRSKSEIFTFLNRANQVCVKLSKNKKHCYYYFNDVDIINRGIELGLGDGPNTLKFIVREKAGES